MNPPPTIIIMILRHIHLPGITKYSHATTLQSNLVRSFLDYKSQPRLSSHAPPEPTLLTFQTSPTYTCGRRERGTLSASQITYLKNEGKAEFHEALRGGQTTFHGPGQLTVFLILSLLDHQLTPRSHIRLLETVTVETCLSYGIKGFTTEHPGVWITPDDKIASVGVHLRRYVSSYGVGLNVSVDLSWFDRIVACGLVGKRATSFEKEGVRGIGVEDVGRRFASYVAARLSGIDGCIESSQLRTLECEVQGE